MSISRSALPALVADTSISGLRVARELDRLLAARGKPMTIVSDNGTELTDNAVLRWADDNKMAWHYIAPGQADPERVHRVVHRPSAGRVAQRDSVPLARAHARGTANLTRRLQHNALSFPARLDDTNHIRCGPAVRCASLS